MTRTRHAPTRAGLCPDPLKLILYFVGVALLGAALAPPLFALGKNYAAWMEATSRMDTPVFGWIANKAERADFLRYFNRAVLVAAVVLIFPFFRWLRMSRADLPSVRPRPGDLRDGLAGFVAAGGLLLAMGLLLSFAGVFQMREHWTWQAVLLTPLIAAVAVAFLEEWLFRGVFTSIVSRAMGATATLWTVALLFAIVHFMEPPQGVTIPDKAVGPATGFQLAGVILAGLAEPTRFLAGFLTLLAVGLILGWARARTRSLWLPIGLHAGWVIVLKGYSAATERARPVDETLPWIGRSITVGLLPLLFLLVTGAMIGYYLRKFHARKL